MNEKKEFPYRRNGVLKVGKNKEIAVTVSCRGDGSCVVLPRSMKDLLFPNVVTKGEKAKKEEVK